MHRQIWYKDPKIGIALVLLALAGVSGCLWYWQQQSRPGIVYAQRGKDDSQAGRLQAAVADWQTGIQEDPTYPGCYEDLGDLYQAHGDNTNAATNYINALKVSPNGILFLKLARVEQGMGDLRAASSAAAHAAELRPNDPDAVGLVGLLDDELGIITPALASLRRAHELRPDMRLYLISLVQLELDNDQFDDAEKDVTPWLAAHPTDTDACYDMAQVLRQKPHTPDNIRAGLLDAQRAVAGRPGDPGAAALLGQFDLDSGRTQEATKILMDAARVAPNDEGVLHGLIQLYMRQDKPALAEATSLRLRAASDRHVQMYHLKCVLYFNHADTDSLLRLARLEEEDGQMNKAEANYISAIHQSPDAAGPRVAMAGFLRRTGQTLLASQITDPHFVP